MPAQAATNFKDVGSYYPYRPAIESLAGAGILGGYSDGSFRPQAAANRAEFVALNLRARGETNLPKPTANCFPDVPADAWFAPAVCAAKQRGFVSGDPAGNFNPSLPVNLAETAKIASGIWQLSVSAPRPGQAWFAPALQTFSIQGFIPRTFGWIGQPVTRGELAEIVWRLANNKHDQPSVSAADLSIAVCQSRGDELDSRFDLARVRAAWLDAVNDARTARKLPAYAGNGQLDRTAAEWSRVMRDRGAASHKRNLSDPYYDYAKITRWFADRGVTVKNVQRVTHSENIGIGILKCSEADCTDELIAAIKPVLASYLREGPGGAHHDSVVNRYFTQLGSGIAVKGNRVYLTTHYATEITSSPTPVCRAN